VAPGIVRGNGISRSQAKKAKHALGRKRRMGLQERAWEKQSGAVRVGRLEDLPENHPARRSASRPVSGERTTA
jgi:hypothetical protein